MQASILRLSAESGDSDCAGVDRGGVMIDGDGAGVWGYGRRVRVYLVLRVVTLNTSTYIEL
jgi:hypothetical protein